MSSFLSVWELFFSFSKLAKNRQTRHRFAGSLVPLRWELASPWSASFSLAESRLSQVRSGDAAVARSTFNWRGSLARGSRVTAKIRYHSTVMKILVSSCGSSFIYDGTFSKTPVRGEGMTAALLRKNGIVVFSEDELDAAEEYVMSLESGDQ
ncbi:MAG TPA: DUF523 domain-containing protein [Thermoanaerobaculia bacterium]